MGSTPKKISASRISKLLGFNKFKNGSVLDLWYELMDEEYPGWLKDNGYNWTKKDISDRPEIQCGLIFERAILEYTANKGELYTGGKFEIEYSDDLMSCHCDSHLYRVNETKPWLNAEAKTSTVFAYRDNWGEPGTDQIPDYYFAQVQQQMGLSGVHRTVVPLLVFPNRQVDIYPYVKDLNYSSLYTIVQTMDILGLFHLYYVDYDPVTFEKMKKVAESFWSKYVVTKTPPLNAPMSRDQKFFIPVHGELSDQEMVKRTQAIKDIDDELKEHDAKLKIKRQLLLRDLIKAAPENRSGKLQLKNEKGRIAATLNSKTGRFTVRRIKNGND